MTIRRSLIGLTIAIPLALLGCHSTSPSSLLQVAGVYDIQKTVTSDTCGAIGPPVSNAGTVTHEAGASRFSLNDHGTRNLPGQVNPDGSMALDASSSLVAGTIPAVDTFTGGRFTTTGFDVQVRTDLAGNPNAGGGPACRVEAAWHATKQGAPNIIPG